MNALLQVRGLSVSLGGRKVLRDLNLNLQRGWTAIIGPNGAGKSTLLRCLAGLQPAERGDVLLNGRPLHEWPSRERARQMAWLGQRGGATGDLCALDVVRLGRLPHLGLFAAPSADDEARVQQAMRDAQCESWSQRTLNQLSGGERQRVLLARALAVDAPILLLDEPTSHLDPPHQVSLIRLVRQLAVERTVMTVLHDLPLAIHADRLIVMREGELVADGVRGDKRIHAAIREVFDDALRIEPRRGGFAILPNLE